MRDCQADYVMPKPPHAARVHERLLEVRSLMKWNGSDPPRRPGLVRPAGCGRPTGASLNLATAAAVSAIFFVPSVQSAFVYWR